MKAIGCLHGRPGRGLILLGLLTSVAVGQMQAAWYVKIDGVPGDAKAGVLEGWTRIASVSPFVRQANDSQTERGGETVITCELEKQMDMLSPALIRQYGSGEVWRRMSLAYIPTESQAAKYRITLDQVRVMSVAQSTEENGADGLLLEKVAIAFEAMEMAHFELNERGGTVGGLTAGYDLTTHGGELKVRPRFRVVVEKDRQGEEQGLLVSWPAESGHRYRILGCAALGAPWQVLGHHSATEDGVVSEFVAAEQLAMFVRVEEVE